MYIFCLHILDIENTETKYKTDIALKRTTTLIKIVCESKNNCEYNTKEMYFLCYPILNNVTIMVKCDMHFESSPR
jgi:hypothetical protein